MKRIYAVDDYLVGLHIPNEMIEFIKVIDPDISYKFQDSGCSLSELAKAQGLKNFDIALPIDWVRDFEEKTGFNPVGHVVMDYSDNTYGLTKPITVEGKVASKIYNHICGKIKL